jgi:predicted nucleotidyltransferase
MAEPLPSTIAQVLNSLLAYQPEKIILFGSAARGDTDEYSDIDLIVVKKTDQRFVQRLVEVMAFVPRDLTVNVDALVYTPDELKAMIEEGRPFIEQALKDGIVLYENPEGNG